MALTDMQCKTAKPKSKTYKLFDGEGLYLEIKPSGAKKWRLKYRLDNTEKRIGFGSYPKISLCEARVQKNAAKALLGKSIDPVLDRLEQQQTAAFVNSTIFQDIAFEWFNKQIESWDPRYAKTVWHRLEKYAFPDLGEYPVAMIKPLVILNCIEKIEKTAPEMARRVLRYCHYIFLYAIATARRENDPTFGLVNALKKYKKGHFASIEVDQLSHFIYDLHEHKFKLKRQTFLAIKLMFLTFVRTSELIKSEWREFDFSNSIWVIPGERMKMDRPFIVPLCRQATSLLFELKELNGNSPYVFPSFSKPGKHMSNGTILVALKRMGYKNKMTGHGFRSLAMGILKEKIRFQP